ncbi:hypothetical protein EfmJHP38_26750 [Enterococcus faecium]|nr:hypothetical protein EfmJHP38_26750 [Enterococcus faecium]
MLEPYLSFKIYAPQEYLSRAYNDAPKYCANIVDTQLKNNDNMDFIIKIMSIVRE